MSAALQNNPSREDFAALLDKIVRQVRRPRGSVIKGKVVAIEKDMAVIDIGLKTEGRVRFANSPAPAAKASSSSATRSRSISTVSRMRSARP